jgi:NRPS condensation-like uncharacterized protein
MPRSGSTVAPAAPITGAAGPLPRLKFGVADELSCYYDGPATPCNIHIEVRVPGGVAEQELRLAVAAALADHPRARVRRAGAGWWRHRHTWEQPLYPDVDPVEVTSWADEEELGRKRAQFLRFSPPLDCSPPLRILLAAGPGEARLILNAHHAAFDGISLLVLLRSAAQHYQTPFPASTVPASTVPASTVPASTVPAPATQPPHEPSPAGLVARTRASGSARPAGPGPGHPGKLRVPGMLPRPAARIAADHGAANPGAANPGAANPEDGLPGYGFRLLELPVPAVPRTGQGTHATVNDLLVAALVVAIGRWNADHSRPGGPIRITMPLNARVPGEDGVTGNRSRLAAVSASPPAAGRNAGQVLDGVTVQTRWAKDHAGPQVDPLSRALAAAWFPAAVKRLMLRVALRTAGPLLCDTSMMTNLGIVADPPRFGQAAAAGIWVTGPAQMPRGLSVAVITLGGQLHLGLRFSRALFSDRAADDFAGACTAALAEVTRVAAGDRTGARQ